MRVFRPLVERPFETSLHYINEAGALKICLILSREVDAAIRDHGALDAEGGGTIERVISGHGSIIASIWEEDVLQLEVATRL